ncbi:MAG TPA: carboxypeptidase-like regulatory domain-containing protein, partial [Planctomycetota bacterium]
MRPLLLLVLAEIVVLALLVLQWSAGSATALANARPGPPATTPAALAVPAATEIPAASTAGAEAERTLAAADDARVDARDPLGILLSGTIRSSDGTLVEGASVGVRRDTEHRGGNSVEPGSFAIAGLLPGEWKLTCRADGFAPHEATITLDDRAFQRADLELSPCWIVRVKVQGADGKSIAEELRRKAIWEPPYVVATEAPLAGDLPPTTRSLFRFGLGEWHSYAGRSGTAEPSLQEQGYCGELRMNRAPPACASLLLRTTLLQSQRLEAGQKELVFTMQASDVLSKHGTVKLRLVDAATGKPIAGASVDLETAQRSGIPGKTSDDGRVVIERVLPGIGMLRSYPQSPQQEGLFRYVRVPAGGTVDLGDILVTASAKITGVVVDGDGKPVNGALVQWTELDCRSFPQPLVDGRGTNAGADGRFELWGCGRHRYVVFARLLEGNEWRIGRASVDATAGVPPPVTITLAKPTSVKLNASFDMTAGRLVTALA